MSGFIDVLLKLKSDFSGLADDLVPVPFTVTYSWVVNPSFNGVCHNECAEAVEVNSQFLTPHNLFKYFPTLKYAIPNTSDWGEGLLRYKYSFAVLDSDGKIRLFGVTFVDAKEVAVIPILRERPNVVGIGFPVFTDVMFDVSKFLEGYADDPNWRKVAKLYKHALDMPSDYYLTPYAPVLFTNENNYDGEPFETLYGWSELYDLLYTMKRSPTAILNYKYFIITVPVSSDVDGIAELLKA